MTANFIPLPNPAEFLADPATRSGGLNLASMERLRDDARRRGETRMLPADLIEHMFLQAAADGINEVMNETAADAINHAPLEFGDLRASALYPAIDELHAAHATPSMLNALVSFDSDYAAAQETGWAWMTRHTTGKRYLWQAHFYTTPGTGAHYLEGAIKMHVPLIEGRVGRKIRERFG